MTTFLDRLLGREPARPGIKAVVADGGAWSNSVGSLALNSPDPQTKAQAYLRAYTVGWFSKAGRKIANDVSSLDWSISLGDAEEGDQEATLDRPDMSLPFQSLDPINQFMRLLEAPYRRDDGRVLITGRALLHKTQVHLDFTGNACWYLQGGTLPDTILPINPARMTPSRDKAGNLIGWVMDKDKPGGGVPFTTDEILWFSTGGADDDVWGTSVVECVYSEVPLSGLMARHTADILTTGGRLAGMMWPKERALTEDEFVDAQRAWRNVASDPNAGRRLLIFPEPMEYAVGAATPADIGIPELSAISRDEVLTAFPISPYMLGVPTPGGLNSGEVRREDRRDYWEGTIAPRADLIEESVQVGLLVRYERMMGQTYDFELSIPNLDDPESLAGKAKAFKDLIGIGLDPQEALKSVGLDHIKWLGLPELLDPAKQAEAQAEAREALAENPPEPRPTVVKARDQREDVTRAIVLQADKDLRAFFRDQRERIAADLAEAFPTKATRIEARKAMPKGWWNKDREDAALEAVMRPIYRQVARSGLQVVADRINRIVYKHAQDPVVNALQRYGLDRIVDINERTREAVGKAVSDGIRRGYSVTQLVEGVPAEGFPGLANAPLLNGQPAFDELRAETIARTETAMAYNRAALEGYKQFGVERVEAVDGGEEDLDEECLDRNGQVFAVEDAMTIEDHPNGTLDWIPLVDEKSWHQEPTVSIPSINITPQIDVHMPEQAAPTVNVTVEPTPIHNEVTSSPPVIIDGGTKARDWPQVMDVRVVDSTLPPKKRKVKRDARGLITEVIEE